MTHSGDQPNAPRKVLVVGMGNPDRGDDGIGTIVVRRLAGRLSGDVAVVERSGDVLSLIEDWAGFDALVLVDAVAPATARGRIHRLDLATEQLRRGMSFASSHALGVAETVELARTLALAPRDIVIYGVEGGSFVGGDSMAAEVEAVAEEVAQRVIVEVARLTQIVT
ncbi:hydrogenase maturation protease [Paraburkholderia phenazinium]|uniref:Hydrogenase maturation protease n=1 Tax=Paraburkholderia phenazinium TaxID=60549 RepID=A0A1G8JYN2_9BURK|nr:hydrogenase maturation protease [Paraburkholderia phenazinium]SDI35660.1 hydrogenase maturation protease [Paraburkholderia phenazinium]